MGCKPDPTALDEDHREALSAVERVTGHEFKTCPHAGLWEPWVHRVVSADEHGLVEDSAGYGPPPRVLVQAVAIVRQAKRRRDATEAETRAKRDKK